MTTAEYRYSSLNKATNEIRLVRIKTGNATDDIECFLTKHISGSIPPYEALSYVWGDPSETLPISIDSCLFRVTTNLHAALRHLRRKDKDRILWIDMICINQSNDDEKNHQVWMMKRIYEGADQVVVWLGVGIDNIGLAFEKLKVVESLPAEEVKSTTLQNLTNAVFGHEAWTALLDLFKLEWWVRIWVVQEVELAKNVLVVCGKYQMSAKSFDKATHNIQMVAIYDIHNRQAPMLTTEVLRISTCKEVGKLSKDLLHLAREYRSRKSTDPRDKLYALLGLAEEMDFEPDYGVSVLEVYRMFVEACIERSGTLDVLSCVDIGSNSDMPSWIPNWSRQGSGLKGLHYYDAWDNAPLFGASGDSKAVFETAFSLAQQKRRNSPIGFDRSLFCSIAGFVTDIVSVRGDHLADLETARTFKSALLQQWLSIYHAQSTLAGPYKTDDDRRNAFFATLSADMIHSKDSTTRISRDPEFYSRELVRWISDESSIWHLESAKLSDLLKFQINFTITSVHRSFFVSEKGYFGLAPSQALPGDLICILFGGQTPFILRRLENVHGTVLEEIQEFFGGNGEVYKVIGDCYVHGIMDGEAYEEFRREGSEVQSEIFVIA